MWYPLPITRRPSYCMYHVQPPAPQYHRLGNKWYVVLTRPRSTSAISKSSSRLPRGSPRCAFRSPIRIISNPLGSAHSACSARCTTGMLFGGTYAPTMYHRLAPDVSRKLSTLRTYLTMLSTCHTFVNLQTTATPPQCLLSASVTQTSYPELFRLCMPFVSLVSCRNHPSTFP